jgi:protocatechuate 3,4-dioxygenase beta subunit
MVMKEQVPRVLTRRELLRIGAAGVAVLTPLGSHWGSAFAQSAIVATPALTEGPYFVDERLNRSDIRVDPTNGAVQQGFPLLLRIVVSRITNGILAPLAGASVDVWHCNVAGIYSDVQDQRTVGQQFLRGYQVTNERGEVRFQTIYPGWYPGRTVHIHVKVRLFTNNRQSYDFTTQFFFDDAITDEVFQLAPYNTRITRNTRNTQDNIYLSGTGGSGGQTSNGTQLLLRVALGGDAQHGVASFRIKRGDF